MEQRFGSHHGPIRWVIRLHTARVHHNHTVPYHTVPYRTVPYRTIYYIPYTIYHTIMTLSLICVCKMKTRFFFMCIEKTNKKYREYVQEAYSKVIEHCYERMEQTKVGTIGYKSHRFRKLIWTLSLLFFCTYIESTGTRKYNRRRGT
jgi:hypothetical protein